MPEFTVKSSHGQHTFESNHPNQQALHARLAALVSSKEIESEHASRLVDGYIRFKGWKDYHEAWAAFHVAKHDHPERFQAGNRTRNALVTGMLAIVQHLVNASQTLKRPVIVLEVEDTTVVLKLNTGGRRPGTVAVSESTRFREGQFYGYIDQDSFEPRDSVTGTDVVEILQRVAVDPARVISEIGRQSGRCCYCPAKLTQVQSKIAGCGKTCSDNYGVEYPNAARTRSILLECPDYLVGATDADRWS
jgi:hypothetical protein